MMDISDFEYGVTDSSEELIALFTTSEKAREFARTKPEYEAVAVYRREYVSVTVEADHTLRGGE